MSTVFEAFLSTAIVVLLLAAVVAGVSFILNNRFSEMRRAVLKAKAEAVAQAVALSLEVNPEWLRDEDGVKRLRSEIRGILNGYVHEAVLGEVRVTQMRVNVSFPLRLLKSGENYRVEPPVNVYVIRFLKGGRYFVESVGGGTVKGCEEGEIAVAVVTSGAVYVIPSSLGRLDSLERLSQTVDKGSFCYLVHFKGATLCVSILEKEGDKTAGELFEFKSDCFVSLQDSFTIKKETIPGAIEWLRNNGFLNAPYGVLCPSLGCYYVYPRLDKPDEPISLFRGSVPHGVVVETARAVAVVNGCAVLVEVEIWD